MNRRLIAAAAAVLLAVIGFAVLLNWVSGVEERAMAGLDPVQVLVAVEPIPEGTTGDALNEMVTTETIPAKAVGPDAVSALEDLSGQVAVTDIRPGEQLLSGRFADPESLAEPAVVEAPEGMHLVSVQLDRPRVIGGHLSPGAKVGVFVSLSPTTETRLLLHKVLVTEVQGGIVPPPPAPTPAPPEEDPNAPAPEEEVPETAPEGAIMVTMAVDPADASKIVFAAEHGSIWLSLENEDAPEGGTSIVTPESVYE